MAVLKSERQFLTRSASGTLHVADVARVTMGAVSVCVQEYSTTWRSLYSVFAAAVGEFDSETYLKHHNPRLSVPLLVVYLFVVSVIMLNLLIALLTNAQEKVSD